MRPRYRTHVGYLLAMALCVPACAAATSDDRTPERHRFDATTVSDDEIALVAQRLHNQVSGRDGSEDAQKRRAAMLNPQVARLLASQRRTEGDPLYGAFAEVKPTDEKDIDFARGYFDPIRTLAAAYALPASRYHHSAEVANAVHVAFAYTRRHVRPGCARPGNWWVWAKQMPDCLCDLLALMHGRLQPADWAYLIAVLDDLLGKGPIRGSGYHTGKAGKDALNVFKVGVLSGDRVRIAHAWECMENEVSPYLLEPDGTPLMTVIKTEFLGISLPYVYEGYDTVLRWAQLARGTHLALQAETTGKLTRYLLDLGRWNTFQGTEVGWISFTAYRVFWRPARTLSLAGQLAQTGVERAAELAAMARRKDTPPTGCRFWPSAETVIFRGDGYYTALVMASKPRHPISWSYKNHFLHIGNRWYYGRDGHLVIARGPADLHPNLTYTLNWRRLSGVTRDAGSLLESSQIKKEGNDYWQPSYALCLNPMAGAAMLDGRDGIAGIEVHSGETRARKSYFFLCEQDMIVTLGSHIRGQGQTDSIVHTFPIGSQKPEILVDGQRRVLAEGRTTMIPTPCWVHGPGGGYVFPDQGRVTAVVETRKPDFTDHGNPPPSRRPKVPPETFITLYFSHGTDPQGATYACAYLPAAATADMPKLATGFRSQATFGRSDVGHFLRYGSLTGAVFFRPGTLAGHTADRPCFLLSRNDRKNVALAAYEPSWQQATLKLTLPEPVGRRTPVANMAVEGKTLAIRTQVGCPVECRLTVSAE